MLLPAPRGPQTFRHGERERERERERDRGKLKIVRLQAKRVLLLLYSTSNLYSKWRNAIKVFEGEKEENAEEKKNTSPSRNFKTFRLKTGLKTLIKSDWPVQ